MEQENLYKSQTGDAPHEDCAAIAVAPLARDGHGPDAGPSGLASITDGTSNTIMFYTVSVDDGAGPHSLGDVWEHAFSSQTLPHHDGIVAIVIGLAVDPSDPSAKTESGVNVVLCDGSVRFVDENEIATAVFDSGADVSASVKASMLASDGFFARFSNTALDDDAKVAVLLGRGDGTFAATHDAKFEDWARVTRFDRGYLPPA